MNRWILAFDQGCSACRDIIGSVQAVAGDKLEARSLNDPEVHELRHQAMGDEPPWAPTLLRIRDDQVHAWTGPAMSIRLARLLGPSRSAKVIRAIARSNVLPNPQRRSLLKAIPGLAISVFVLSGGTAYADNNEARRIRRVEGSQARSVISAAGQDKSIARLRAHLAGQDLREQRWEVWELYEGEKLVRTVAVDVYHSADDERVAYAAYGIETDGERWRLATIHRERDSHVVSVEDGRLTTTSLEPQEYDFWKCFACTGLCALGCSAPCGVMCFLVCAGNGACIVPCGIICGAVCTGARCAQGYCKRWCDS